METKNYSQTEYSNLTNPDLYRRIQQLQIDDPNATAPFTARLAAEMGWTYGFAARAIAEYRRFIYLTQVVGTQVTPSEEVDHVWHFHLAYTASYWDSLCTGILGRPLHHTPTGGGALERERFRRQYAETLAAYAREFGEKPSEMFWPEADIRFGQPLQRMVNMAHSFVMPKPGTGTIAIIAAMLALVIFTPGRVPQPHRFMEIVGAIALGTLIGYIYYGLSGARLYDGIVRKKSSSSSDGGCGSGCGGCG